ncbi:MAG: hypothetical protein AB1758_30740, partial [Candidatus Eremiobacterota bacterium]
MARLVLMVFLMLSSTGWTQTISANRRLDFPNVTLNGTPQVVAGNNSPRITVNMQGVTTGFHVLLVMSTPLT